MKTKRYRPKRSWTVEQRLYDRCRVEPGPEKTPCWIWLGSVNTEGYGNMQVNGVVSYVHRIAYTHWKGPIPHNLEIDHLCARRSCFNPDHLDAVSHRVNRLRGRNAQTEKAACKNGHGYNDQNTLWAQQTNANGTTYMKRICRRCAKIWNDRHRARRRAISTA